MTEEQKNEFIKKLLDYEKIIFEQQQPEIEYRNKLNEQWKNIEVELSKIQDTFRSKAFQIYKMYSVSLQPVSEQLKNKLISEMTDNEKKVLNYD